MQSTDWSVVTLRSMLWDRSRRRRRRLPGDATRDLSRPRSICTASLAHRALTMHPVAAVPCRLVDLDHDRNAAARVGRGAPQAPRRDRHGRGPAQPARRRVLAGAARQRRALQAGRERQRRTRASTPATSRTTAIDKLAFDYSLVGLGIGIAILVVVMCAPRLRAAGRVPRGRHPRRDLRDARPARSTRSATGSASSPYANSATNGQLARARHGRRRPAQQPPRRAHVGTLRAAAGRDRSGLVARAHAGVLPSRARPPRRPQAQDRRVVAVRASARSAPSGVGRGRRRARVRAS